jgi:hypothetical protein
MAFPSFVNRIELTSESQARSKPLEQQGRVLLICHHAATTSLSAITSLFQPGGRTVSANFAIGNDGTVVGCVDPSRRAWTSASGLDDIAITFECANLSSDGWTISDASYQAIAKIARWMDSVYPGFSIDREHIVGHKELYSRWGESYATACPGGMNLDHVVNLARQGSSTAVDAVTNILEGDIMPKLVRHEDGPNFAHYLVGETYIHGIEAEHAPNDVGAYEALYGKAVVVKGPAGMHALLRATEDARAQIAATIRAALQ